MTVTKEALKAVLEEVFEERSRIDAASHAEHHAWIQERIEAERARKKMYFEIAKAVAQFSVLGILGYVSGVAGEVVHWVRG